MTVSLGLAFLAGLASFLSPCVLSLMPAVIGYFGGRSFAGRREGQRSKRLKPLMHGLAFVLGFSLVFIALGFTASFIGSFLFMVKDWVARIGGIVVILMGLHLSGVIHIPWLDYDQRLSKSLDQQGGVLASFLMGVFFSAGWSPCVGPVLGSILTLAVNYGSTTEGVFLLSSYSAGMALPFLATVLALDWVSDRMRSWHMAMVGIQKLMGILLIVVGVLLFLGLFEQLARFSPIIDTNL